MSIRIYEVSPRDGLQYESTVLGTDDKLALISALVSAGLRDVEVTSFVRPSWVPQLADAMDVATRLPDAADVRFWALVPNRRGLERALDAGIRHVATFMSSSETHNRKNLNRTRAESLAALRDVIGISREEGLGVRAYLSTAFGCPFEGDVPPDQVAQLARALVDAGAQEISLGDTTGMANPDGVTRVIEALDRVGVPPSLLALHMHDTNGSALVNCYAGYLAGVRVFDGSVAGVGGCPTAPGAAGNVASEDMLNLFDSMGVESGVDMDRLVASGLLLSDLLGRPLPGRVHTFHRVGDHGVKIDTDLQTAG